MTRFQKLVLGYLAVGAYIGCKVGGSFLMGSDNKAEVIAGGCLLAVPEIPICLYQVVRNAPGCISACFRDCRDAWNEDQQVPLAGNQNDIVEV